MLVACLLVVKQYTFRQIQSWSSSLFARVVTSLSESLSELEKQPWLVQLKISAKGYSNCIGLSIDTGAPGIQGIFKSVANVVTDAKLASARFSQ